MPSSLPSFFLSLCTTLFAFVPWVPSGTALVLSLVGCFLFLPVGCPCQPLLRGREPRRQNPDEPEPGH